MIDHLEYSLETIRNYGEFILYRGRRQTDETPSSVLALTPASEPPPLACLRRMENEYSLRTDLDPGWAVSPLALVPYKERTMLVLTDPGGEPLDRLLGRPMELTQFLRFAIGLATALGQLHGRGLIHKDIKPANILVNSATGQVLAHGLWHRFAPSARAPGARTSRVHRRNTRLHGARTDRTNESLDRFPQRPLRPRRHALRDADRQPALHGFRSDGMGALPHRKTAGAAQRAVEEMSRLRSRQSS